MKLNKSTTRAKTTYTKYILELEIPEQLLTEVSKDKLKQIY